MNGFAVGLKVYSMYKENEVSGDWNYLGDFLETPTEIFFSGFTEGEM